jgi:pimeloyl-ACP methyl ester carboxylesterase
VALPTWLLVVLSVLVGIALLYVAAAFAASCWLTRPTRGQPTATPADHGLAWEPFTVIALDGVQLAGWVVTPLVPRGTAVVFHGLRGSRDQTLARVVLLVRAGFRCVAIDFRGHGLSGGWATSFGYHEARDVAAALDLVRQRWPERPIALLGMSMGAAAICFAAEHARSCQAIVLESLYHDIASAFTVRLTKQYPFWFRPLVPGIVRLTEWRLGVRLKQVIPAEYIGKLAPAPVLLLTGSEDDHASPAEAHRLFDRCGEPRELWIAPGASHCDVLETAGKAYEERVLEFLDRYLAGISGD